MNRPPPLNNSQSLCYQCDEILDIRDYCRGAQAPSVKELVDYELVRIHPSTA